jgi:hypothetical protein
VAVVFPYTKQTWTDGVSSCSAARNNVHEDGIYNAHNAPSVRVYHTTTQTVLNNTETALAFDAERWDVAGGAASTQHDTVTNNSRLTALYAGKYLVEAHVEWDLTAAGNRQCFFRINGTVGQQIGTIALAGSASLFVKTNPHSIVNLAVNDYVQVIVLQDSGGTRTISLSGALLQDKCEFMMTRVA